MAYRQLVSRALGWSAGAKAASQAISFVLGVLLARLLTPDDFGLIAMVAVFTGFAALLGDVGLGSALVQKVDASERHFSTVFWTNMGLGTLLFMLLFLLAGPIAHFYGRGELVAATRVLAFSFLISALAMVQRQRLVRSLDFKVLAISDFAGMVVGGGVGLVLALKGKGYWALITQALVQQGVATLFVWGRGGWHPRFLFDKAALRELIGFSFYVFATNCLLHVSRNIDKLLVGKLMGGAAAGVLDKAQSMVLFPIQNISHVISSVMFPAFSRIQSDAPRVRSVYLKSIQAIALLAFPMMMGIFAVAESFVLGVLGAQWAGVISILQLLCFGGLASSIATVSGSVYLSQGAAKLQFYINLVTRPIAILAVLVGLFWGLQGVAVGLVTAIWINTLITLRSAADLIGLRLHEVFIALFRPMLAAALMAVVVCAVKYLLVDVPPLVVLLLQVSVGMLTYMALVFLLKVPQRGEIVRLLRSR